MQDIETCKSLFTRADKNKDGKIDAGELKRFLEALGEHVSESICDDLLQEVDADKNGVSHYQLRC